MFTGVTTYSNSTAFLKGGDYRDKNFCKNGEIDYYPFGMLMPNRYTGASEYTYGFQGQEMDNEIRGSKGTSVNYKYRMHDARIGRFFAVDPLFKDYPHNSVYAFSENRVIDGVELEGLEYQSAQSAFRYIEEGFMYYFAALTDVVTFQSSGSATASHKTYGTYSASYSVNTNSFSEALLSQSVDFSDYFPFDADFSVSSPKGDLGPIQQNSGGSVGTDGVGLTPMTFSSDDFVPYPMRVPLSIDASGEIKNGEAVVNSSVNLQVGYYNFDYAFSKNYTTGEEINSASVGIGTKDNQVYGRISNSSTEGTSISMGAKASVKKEVGEWTLEAKASAQVTVKLD